MKRFVIKETKTGIKFDLKAKNGEIIANSEVYSTRQACCNGIASVIKNAPLAKIEDQTIPNFEKCKNPKFEVYLDHAGEFRFRLKAKNGQVIAVSAGYQSKANCLRGIASVCKNVADEER